jgi:hypothetical protein
MNGGARKPFGLHHHGRKLQDVLRGLDCVASLAMAGGAATLVDVWVQNLCFLSYPR